MVVIISRVFACSFMRRNCVPAFLVPTVLLSSLGLIAALSDSRPSSAIEIPVRGERAQTLSQARLWGCQYQNINVDRLAASNLDLIVIDHALGQPNIIVASPEDVQRLKRKPDGSRRIVLAYISVGEAEDFRPYWKRAWAEAPPSWLGSSNPDWPGAYGVRFWESAWKQIVYAQDDSILDRIIAAGFDGAFLDRVDAYAEWRGIRRSAKEDMINLVAELSQRARNKSRGFLIMSQNAEGLLKNSRYRNLIDGVTKESLLFGLNGPGIPNSRGDVAWSLAGLNAAVRDGIPVFSIEYIDDPQKIALARRKLESFGFIPFFANRALDQLPKSP